MTAGQDGVEVWPTSRTTVRLLWADGHIDVRAMRAVDDDTLLCSTADHGPDAHVPPADTPVEVQWADAQGLWARPATLARRRFDMVTLMSTGPVRREQRRRYYRAPVSLEVEIVHGDEVLRGRTNDLSEGGARVTVEGSGPLPRAAVTTRVSLRHRMLSIPTTVVRSADHGPNGELGVEFGIVSPPEADAIRREVINAQIDERRKEQR